MDSDTFCRGLTWASVRVERPDAESIQDAASSLERGGPIAIRFEVFEKGKSISRNIICYPGRGDTRYDAVVLESFKYYQPQITAVVVYAYYPNHKQKDE